jgi:hypothetical protein
MIIGAVKFEGLKEYHSKAGFDADYGAHRVPLEHQYAWAPDEKSRVAYKVVGAVLVREPQPCTQKEPKQATVEFLDPIERPEPTEPLAAMQPRAGACQEERPCPQAADVSKDVGLPREDASGDAVGEVTGKRASGARQACAQKRLKQSKIPDQRQRLPDETFKLYTSSAAMAQIISAQDTADVSLRKDEFQECTRIKAEIDKLTTAEEPEEKTSDATTAASRMRELEGFLQEAKRKDEFQECARIKKEIDKLIASGAQEEKAPSVATTARRTDDSAASEGRAVRDDVQQPTLTIGQLRQADVAKPSCFDIQVRVLCVLASLMKQTSSAKAREAKERKARERPKAAKEKPQQLFS